MVVKDQDDSHRRGTLETPEEKGGRQWQVFRRSDGRNLEERIDVNITKVLSMAVLVIIVLGFSLSYVAIPAHALPNSKIASMPNCASSVSQQVFDSSTNVVWQNCYITGVLSRQDFTTNPTTVTTYATGGLMSSANPIGMGQDTNNLYATVRVSREVFKIPKADPTLSV